MGFNIFQRCDWFPLVGDDHPNSNAGRIVGWVDWLEGFESAASRDFLGLKLENYSNSHKGSIVHRTLLCYLLLGCMTYCSRGNRSGSVCRSVLWTMFSHLKTISMLRISCDK